MPSIYVANYTKAFAPAAAEAFNVTTKLEFTPEDNLQKELTYLSNKGEYKKFNPRTLFEEVAGKRLDQLWQTCKTSIDTAINTAWEKTEPVVARVQQKKARDVAFEAFAKIQVKKAEELFAAACKTWSADALRLAKPLVLGFTTGETMVHEKPEKSQKGAGDSKEETKKVSAADAFTFYTDANPFTFTVTEKFETDHMDSTETASGKGLTGGEATTLALERFSKKGSKTSSWLDLSKAAVITKVKASPNKVAAVFKGQQQIAIIIKVDSVTVNVQELTAKEIKGGQFKKSAVAVKRGTQTVQVTTSVDERPVVIKVIGPWKPLTGEVDVYHYEKETAAGQHEMLPKYLEFVMRDDGTPLRPVATK